MNGKSFYLCIALFGQNAIQEMSLNLPREREKSYQILDLACGCFLKNIKNSIETMLV